MAYGETYEEFVDKFKEKHTTDDCFTPPVVYEAIASWVAENYKVKHKAFFRPFYVGGDYQSENYDGKIVVDNPPFSILSKITDFYTKNSIKFFLFAPTLTLFDFCRNDGLAVIPTDGAITYENGAKVNTSFVTNLEPQDVRVHGYPDLYKAIQEANKSAEGEKKKYPKYKYPDSVVSSAIAKEWKHTDFVILKSESKFIRQLDSQKEAKKAIFGGGLLVSKAMEAKVREAKVREAKAREAKTTTTWELSEREKKIIEELSKKDC